jgi:Domain of unknown function (DUF4440)
MANMRRLALCLVLLVSCFSSTPIQAQNGLADEVKQAEQKWIAAVKSKDAAAMEAILAKERVYTHSTGLVEDKNPYIAPVTSGNQKYDSIDYEAPAIQTYRSTAVLATKVVMTGSTRGQSNRLRLLHVWD